MKDIQIDVQEIYNMDEKAYSDFLSDIDQSLNPRSPEVMYDKFASFEINKDSVILDAGCRDARHLIELAKKYDCRLEGIDIVESNIIAGSDSIRSNKLEERIRIGIGDIHSLTYENESIDYIWCRDVMTHLDDLGKAFKSLYRVLKGKGKIVIFHVTATELLTSDEADSICKPLATIKKNLDCTYFETVFKEAGLKCIEKDIIGTEWRESYEEAGRNLSSKQLMRIAKLMRNKKEFIDKHGEKNYAVELANCHWGVYQMLGKLSPVIYVLEKE